MILFLEYSNDDFWSRMCRKTMEDWIQKRSILQSYCRAMLRIKLARLRCAHGLGNNVIRMELGDLA